MERHPSPALIYAYHTDATGRYMKTGDEKGVQRWHGHLYGWCRTDSGGRYSIRSIRPAPYPDGSMPAHIHAAIREEGKPPYYINDFVFADDPLVNAAYLKSLINPGGSGVVPLARLTDGTWLGKRDILLNR